MPLTPHRQPLRNWSDRILCKLSHSLGAKTTLAALVLGSAVLVSSATPARAGAGCTLTAKTPKLLGSGNVRMYGWVRCHNTQARSVEVDNGAILASGRKVTLNGNGTSCLRRSTKRCGFLETESCQQLTHSRWQAHFGSPPKKVFVRVTLFRGNSSKILKRKDSRAVSLAKLCPQQTR